MLIDGLIIVVHYADCATQNFLANPVLVPPPTSTCWSTGLREVANTSHKTHSIGGGGSVFSLVLLDVMLF